MSIQARKYLLLAVIAASYVPLLFFFHLPSYYSPLGSLANSYWLADWARLLGWTGLIMLWWQFVIGFRGFIPYLIVDAVWVNKQHQKIGKYGTVLIFLHPTLMLLSYLPNLIAGIEAKFGIYYLMGVTAMSVLLFIWITSAFFRKQLGFRMWKRLHFLAYIILPLVLLHSRNLGSLVKNQQLLDSYWAFLCTTWVLFLVLRILFHFGFGKSKYKITNKEQITPTTYQYRFQHLSGKYIEPTQGQFVHYQSPGFGEDHPYSFSHYYPETKEFGLTVKTLGRESTKMTEIAVGQEVYLDGPYGVFTRELAQDDGSDSVFIAGGIGITPMLERSRTSPERKGKTYLFYGNKTVGEIAFLKELQGYVSDKYTLVNVLNDPTGIETISGPVETGFITTDILKKYIPSNEILAARYFICGPKPMMDSLKKALVQMGVKKSRIKTEEF